MIRSSLLATLALASCATSPRTEPHDMSAAGHDEAAAAEEAASVEYLVKYDPGEWRGRDCSGIRLGEKLGVCWSEPRNPTARHLEEAEQRAAEAKRHRAASKALRDAEEAACSGIADADRDESPFLHRGDLLAAVPLREGGRTTGAAVRFRDVAGLTPEALEKIASCHAARNAVLGHDRPDSSWCPLAVPGIRIGSEQRSDEIVLRITSTEEAQAEEVLRRVNAVLSSAVRHPHH